MQVVLDCSEFQAISELDHLLHNADDEIVAVIIKGTQGLSYRDSLARAFAECCTAHNTPFGFYDFMTNDQASDQESAFAAFLSRMPTPSIVPWLDCEGAYNKFAAGDVNRQHAYGGKVGTYAQLSLMDRYADVPGPKWVAQYDSMRYTRPTQAEIDAYRAQGFTLWQFTDNYMGLNQDASVLLGSLADIKR